MLGNNEHRLPGSPHDFILRFNRELRALADAEGVDVVALDAQMARDGIRAWHDPALWHRAKQEVSPAAAPMYGELVARLIAARQGRLLWESRAPGSAERPESRAPVRADPEAAGTPQAE